jgi:RimJ/RimL family protein N-acetyltransferase
VGLDPELWRFIPYRVTTAEEMRDYIRAAQGAEAAGSALPFATIERVAGRVVGSTRFLNIDKENQRMEIGSTWVAKQWQRTGINTEAKYLMLRYAFETLGCIRVELKTDATNQRSREAILRIGAREEGVLSSHMLTWSGRVRDTVYYSIIETEWPSVRKGLEAKLGGSEVWNHP